MDDATRKATVERLARATDFAPTYREESRRWFAEKCVRRLEAAGVPDGQVEQDARAFIRRVRDLVKSEQDFRLAIPAAAGSPLTPARFEATRRRRVEILYGLIATSPELAEAPHAGYRALLAKRRYRGVSRMDWWVNPNKQGYFRYPAACGGAWRVNVDAQQHWERVDSANELPLKLKRRDAPIPALEALFARKVEPCLGNLLDCSVVAGIILMDTLREALDPARFLAALAAIAPNYLHIAQIGTVHEPTVIHDSNPRGAFDELPVPMDDMQVGDRVYFFNHPLYLTFRPEGDWRGEHALVYACGNRSHRSKKGWVLGGHGMYERTLPEFYAKVLTRLHSDLALVRRLAWVHLAFMRGGPSAIVPGTATSQDAAVKIGDQAPAVHQVVEYKKQVSSHDRTRVPTKSRRTPRQVVPGFVAVHLKDVHAFLLDQVPDPDDDIMLGVTLKKTRGEVVVPAQIRHPITVVRSDPPAGAPPAVIYDIREWGILYENPATSAPDIYPFFKRLAKGSLVRNELALDDLLDSAFQRYAHGTDLEVIRPRADFAGPHISFLQANGAI